uniref:Uncharacterized protein n=1 Tax=Arundo donax TaxID=35708 RepID=A0A0A9LD93_ARUDO
MLHIKPLVIFPPFVRISLRCIPWWEILISPSQLGSDLTFYI